MKPTQRRSITTWKMSPDSSAPRPLSPPAQCSTVPPAKCTPQLTSVTPGAIETRSPDHSRTRPSVRPSHSRSASCTHTGTPPKAALHSAMTP